MAGEQRRVLFSGSVQGVGFRFTACRVASRYDVTGYVRNLPDGRVECLAEGDSTELDAFFADLTDAMSGYIREQTRETAPCSGQFRNFGIRY